MSLEELEERLRQWEAIPLDGWNRRVVARMVAFLREQIEAKRAHP